VVPIVAVTRDRREVLLRDPRLVFGAELGDEVRVERAQQ
jgi:hypothetical protein